jgi:hypothetical protein
MTANNEFQRLWRSWPNLSYHVVICKKGLKKAIKFVGMNACTGDRVCPFARKLSRRFRLNLVWERYHSNICIRISFLMIPVKYKLWFMWNPIKMYWLCQKHLYHQAFISLIKFRFTTFISNIFFWRGKYLKPKKEVYYFWWSVRYL